MNRNRTVLVCWVIATICFLSCESGERKDAQFDSLSSSYTGVGFVNQIDDHDTLSILSYEYLYNGGGVAIADFNGDSLQDVFFTGNMVDNALYLNKGNLKFQDISEQANIAGKGKWSYGVTTVDINLDGRMDIYVASTGHDDIANKKNQLYINQGVNDQGVSTFIDMAAPYGVDDNTNSTQSAFFDYDNDGDLDLFVIVNKLLKNQQPSRYHQKPTDGSADTKDRLYRNDWNDELGHPVFTDVGMDAGILYEGFSLGLTICDINHDGWKDVYITNDYLTNDLLYINNQDGTFSDEAAQYFKHTSFSAMGHDVVDMDNDGDAEIVALDMLPENNYRRKTMLPPNKYSDYLNNERFGYQYQNMRNTLQANAGIGADGRPLFQEIGLLAGIGATDWSWAPLAADFDNDGWRDLIVTNGFPKDVTDRDFIDYHSDVASYASHGHLIEKIPSVKIKNYAFQNKKGLSFENVTDAWGIEEPTFSNGAAYGDLDNDGDLDYVVNNINMPASIYENKNLKGGWIRMQLNGPKANPLGLGTLVTLYDEELGTLSNEFTLTRGYLSSVEPFIHFGLDSIPSVDSIVVKWADGKRQKLENVSSNQLIVIDYSDAQDGDNDRRKGVLKRTKLKDVSASIGLDYVHEEIDFIDYNVQPMLPHKLSQYGPSLAVGDVNGDGLDDLFIGGSHFHKGEFWVQQKGGQLEYQDLIDYSDQTDYKSEELGALLFDADGDGDNDLFVVHGGNEFAPADSQYVDRVYENQNGRFVHQDGALPKYLNSGLALKAADYDNDGDLDIFLGGRVVPDQYPLPADSYILRNDSKLGQILFTDVTSEVAPVLTDIGMVTDALWTDFDNDNLTDLILVGEYMPVTFLKNGGGTFQDVTSLSGTQNEIGWWNSIVAGDFDNDNDIDYVVGNVGSNTIAQVSDDHPIKMYYNDFDRNGTGDLFPSCYFSDTMGVKREYPYFGRLEIKKQYNTITKRFKFHKELAVTTTDRLFTKEEMDSCLILSANNMHTSYIENMGNGQFQMKPLQSKVQRAPIYGMTIEDINNDGNLDIIMVGNDYGMEISLGRMDAHDGIVALGDGKSGFEMLEISESGFQVRGDAKALVQMNIAGRQHFIASQNRGPLRTFENDANLKTLSLNPSDRVVEIQLKDGRTRRQEKYHGSSFLSQSTSTVFIGELVNKIIVLNSKGEKREVNF